MGGGRPPLEENAGNFRPGKKKKGGGDVQKQKAVGSPSLRVGCGPLVGEGPLGAPWRYRAGAVAAHPMRRM